MRRQKRAEIAENASAVASVAFGVLLNFGTVIATLASVRVFIIVGWLVLGYPIASAEQRATGGDVTAKTLTANDVERYLAPYVNEVRDCYLNKVKPPATRTLRLELIIHRDGTVFRLGVIAPQVPKPIARKIETCIRAAASEWHFPPRSGFTHVTVPFFFHRATAPGAGPYPSCWSPRGCPGQGDSKAPQPPPTATQTPPPATTKDKRP